MFLLHSKHSHSTFDRAGARMLGLTSLAVGLSELIMPGKIEKWLGIGQRPAHRHPARAGRSGTDPRRRYSFAR